MCKPNETTIIFISTNVWVEKLIITFLVDIILGIINDFIIITKTIDYHRVKDNQYKRRSISKNKT